MKTETCPCGTGKEYALCCGRYHRGELAPTALQLMRSRYSAYALGLIDYILETTHPQHPDFKRDQEEWKNELHAFSAQTIFKSLEIVDFQEGENISFVTFIAYLNQAGQDVVLRERSLFEKIEN